jgi:glucosamine-6-phosphate deaminase
MLKNFKQDKLEVMVFENRSQLGTKAAAIVAAKIKDLLARKSVVNLIFAAAPSQSELLAALVTDDTIDWPRINAFHMDEYLGLNADAPQLFGNFLKRSIFDLVPLGSVHYINGQSISGQDECERYSTLLKQYPPDVVCLGIGENAHIAFNDPPVADFKDVALVKVVTLDQDCRQQQVNDGCFASVDKVPARAITLTIPALMQSSFIYCVVPGPSKRQAVMNTLQKPVSEQVPSTIIRSHPSAILFVDKESFELN